MIDPKGKLFSLTQQLNGEEGKEKQVSIIIMKDREYWEVSFSPREHIPILNFSLVQSDRLQNIYYFIFVCIVLVIMQHDAHRPPFLFGLLGLFLTD